MCILVEVCIGVILPGNTKATEHHRFIENGDAEDQCVCVHFSTIILEDGAGGILIREMVDLLYQCIESRFKSTEVPIVSPFLDHRLILMS